MTVASARPGACHRAWKGRHALCDRHRIERSGSVASCHCRRRPLRQRSPSACLPFQARGTLPERTPATAAYPSYFPDSVQCAGSRAMETKKAPRGRLSPEEKTCRGGWGSRGSAPQATPASSGGLEVTGVAGGVHPGATSPMPQDRVETTSDAALPQTKSHQSMNDHSSPDRRRIQSLTWNWSIVHWLSARTSGRPMSSRRATRK